MKPDSDSANNIRFAELGERHLALVYRLCLRLCGGCTAEAEDLTQETLCAAFQALPRFRGQAAITTYLYSIAVLRWRKLRARRTLETVSLFEAQEPSQPDGIPAHLTRLSLHDAMNALPDDLREAFTLVKAEGRTHKEAAKLLGIPQGTVQWRVHEAVKRLRVLLSDDDTPTKDTSDA